MGVVAWPQSPCVGLLTYLTQSGSHRGLITVSLLRNKQMADARRTRAMRFCQRVLRRPPF